TITNEITEKFPCELFPYVTHSVFAACPTGYSLAQRDLYFKIDPSFIFYDQYNDIVGNGWDLEIDFGDGVGYRSINPSTLAYIFVSYGSAGKKTITTRIRFNGVTIKTSRAGIIVPGGSGLAVPSRRIFLPGLTANMYDPCEESGGPYKKIIIYVEGYDPGDFIPFNNRRANEIYRDQILENGMAELQNFGYSFVVVDWRQSGRDIRLNAMDLVELINILKCEQANEDLGDNQFVIIGESMGGLVAKYASMWMEQHWQEIEGCNDDKMHNTRLLITLDAPHRGANLPLAYQHLYRDAGMFLLGSNTITQSIAGTISNLLLDATSVKQMLIYHVD